MPSIASSEESVPLFWCYQCRAVVPLISDPVTATAAATTIGASGAVAAANAAAGGHAIGGRAAVQESQCPICGDGFLESVQSADMHTLAVTAAARVTPSHTGSRSVPLPVGVLRIPPALSEGHRGHGRDRGRHGGGDQRHTGRQTRWRRRETGGGDDDEDAFGPQSVEHFPELPSADGVDPGSGLIEQ